MRLLLDTHALLWWLAGERRLSRRARSTIEDESNTVYVSAASAWEVATKHRIGRLPDVAGLASEFAREVAQQGFVGLDITLDHGQRAGNLPGPHRDPFDRMLIAQAQAENLWLVSNEAIFDRYGITRIW
ncbi:MAG TPA: type II toxin-antitoxin system VapC family toxin [Gemmatimonadaceae bacterium]|nr:type II toxin-antitoxin system VapC family toxin [Gemmatimonadaceae bacterium]